MAEPKITIDENTVEKARVQASEEGTSVDALLRDYLEEYAGGGPAGAAGGDAEDTRRRTKRWRGFRSWRAYLDARRRL